jgi:RNA polymerase sigma-70 factor (ECF subfamily)
MTKGACVRVLWTNVDSRAREFERRVMPHLDAAYNLARWLTGNDADARDAVQEACVRALKGIDGLRGGAEAAGCWMLAIVRNTCYTLTDRRGVRRRGESLEDGAGEALVSADDGPLEAAARSAEAASVREAIEVLPAEFREVIVLREIEGLSYKEIAQVAGVPVGTVMSRLARARERLQERLAPQLAIEGGAR